MRSYFSQVFPSFVKSRKNVPTGSLTREVFTDANYAKRTAGSRTVKGCAEVSNMLNPLETIETEFLPLGTINCLDLGAITIVQMRRCNDYYTTGAVLTRLHLPNRIPVVEDGNIFTDFTQKYIYEVYSVYLIYMLGENDVYSEPDSTREPWAFLVVETTPDGKISGWQVGYGNSTRITRIEHSLGGDERIILQYLVKEICANKRAKILITRSREVLPLLRSRILQHRARVSFRGLRHVCLEVLLALHFSNIQEITMVAQNPREIWKLLISVGPLVPTKALQGEPL